MAVLQKKNAFNVNVYGHGDWTGNAISEMYFPKSSSRRVLLAAASPAKDERWRCQCKAEIKCQRASKGCQNLLNHVISNHTTSWEARMAAADAPDAANDLSGWGVSDRAKKLFGWADRLGGNGKLSILVCGFCQGS
jgi:hypothetical protein